MLRVAIFLLISMENPWIQELWILCPLDREVLPVVEEHGIHRHIRDRCRCLINREKLNLPRYMMEQRSMAVVDRLEALPAFTNYLLEIMLIQTMQHIKHLLNNRNRHSAHIQQNLLRQQALHRRHLQEIQHRQNRNTFRKHL